MTNSNYDHAIKLHIHNSEVAERAVNTFLISESIIFGFLSNGFFKCCDPQVSQNTWLLLGGSVFGLLLIIPWWGSYSYRLGFNDLWHAQIRKYENKDAVAGQIGRDAETLSKEGKVAINREAVFIGCFAMKVRNAYRFLMIMFAIAFILMSIASFLKT